MKIITRDEQGNVGLQGTAGFKGTLTSKLIPGKNHKYMFWKMLIYRIKELYYGNKIQ